MLHGVLRPVRGSRCSNHLDTQSSPWPTSSRPAVHPRGTFTASFGVHEATRAVHCEFQAHDRLSTDIHDVEPREQYMLRASGFNIEYYGAMTKKARGGYPISFTFSAPALDIPL